MDVDSGRCVIVELTRVFSVVFFHKIQYYFIAKCNRTQRNKNLMLSCGWPRSYLGCSHYCVCS